MLPERTASGPTGTSLLPAGTAFAPPLGSCPPRFAEERPRMRYVALATDYDGTLATEGVVTDSTIAALERFIATGRQVVLVTGRQLDDLAQVFAHIGLFSRVIAE